MKITKAKKEILNQFDLIVVGAGPGGYVAAIRGAQLGLKTAIIEANHLGGICLNWGCIPTKALLRSAQMYQEFNHADDYGLSVGEVGFDLNKIVQRSRDVSTRLTSGIEHLLKKNKIVVFTGYARLKESTVEGFHQVLVDEMMGLSARHIILATGARARSFAGLEPDGETVWSYKEALVPEKMPKSMLVIGSGAIGIEFANFYHAFGCEVTVVEAMDQIMPAEDTEIATVAQNAMAQRGIQFKLNTKVTNLNRQPDSVTVTLVKDETAEHITVEKVITAVGVQPNVENLNLEQAGISLDERGFIKVDGYCQTAVEGIYAIGDVAGAPCLAHKASHEAMICVEKIVAQEDGNANVVQPMDKSMIPACTYGFPQVASIGLTEQQAIDKGLAIKVGRFPFQANGKAIAQGETEGLVKVIFCDKTGELLGAHMVGSEVTELIHGLTVAKTMETTEEELMETIFPHPTLSEMVHESVLAAYGRAIHV
jgi:dihydrolipoamide dehydrogenase